MIFLISTYLFEIIAVFEITVINELVQGFIKMALFQSSLTFN
jgi:hypothetical protein